VLFALFIVAITCGALSAQRDAVAAQKCPTIEVSIVTADLTRTTRQISSDKDKRIFLTEKPLLTMDDFTHANVSLTEGQFVLNLDMTAQSAERIQMFTRKNVGKTMAFIVNGRLIRTPNIKDPVTGTGFLIGPLGRQQAQTLADAINHKDRNCKSQGERSR
jgi:preprotein translocase subunit SecD